MDSFEGTRVVAIMSTFACGGRDFSHEVSAFIVSCLSVSYCIMLVSTQLDVTVSTDVVRKDRQSRDLPLTVA
jgi:hypothetical protein